MFRKKDLKHDTILGIGALLFVTLVYIFSFIEKHIK